MARSTTCSNQRPDTLMQDRSPPARRNRLQRTVGPYIWVKLGSGSASTLLLLCPNERTSRDTVTESFGAKMGSRAYWQIDSESVPKAARGGGHTVPCDASQGSTTILPPSPPASIRA